MANDQEVKYLVPGLERGLQLLLAFGEQHRDLTFAELHRLVDMPKATAYRVVQTLEYMGFLERNARTNTFSLGMNVLRLGRRFAYQPGQRRNAATGALHLAWPHAADRCFPQRV